MKYVWDFDKNELVNLFNNNNSVQRMVLDAMEDNASFWTQEYLDCWNSGVDYCIGYDRGAFFSVTDADGFIDGLKEAQRMFAFLPDDDNVLIEHVSDLLCKRWNIRAGDCENEERLQSRIDELCDDLAGKVFERFMNEFENCFSFDAQLDYFLSFFVNERMEGFYIDDDGELCEEVHYIKRYA